MSQDLQNKINELTEANKNLTQQIVNHSNGAEALMAQLEAHKGMLNESLTASLNLKTHIILLDKKIKRLEKQLQDSTAKENTHAINS